MLPTGRLFSPCKTTCQLPGYQEISKMEMIKWCLRCTRNNSDTSKIPTLQWFGVSSHLGVLLATCPLSGGAAACTTGDKWHFLISRPKCQNAAVFTFLAEQGGHCQPLAGQATNKFMGFFLFYGFNSSSVLSCGERRVASTNPGEQKLVHVPC